MPTPASCTTKLMHLMWGPNTSTPQQRAAVRLVELLVTSKPQYQVQAPWRVRAAELAAGQNPCRLCSHGIERPTRPGEERRPATNEQGKSGNQKAESRNGKGKGRRHEGAVPCGAEIETAASWTCARAYSRIEHLQCS